MQYIGTSKISKLNPKPNLTYPLIRLPQRYNTVIGKTAHIYESFEEGQKAIVLVFDETENQEKVIQPVIKQNAESDFSARFAVLEEEIRELRTLIEKEAHFSDNIQKIDGLGRIRTGDLRHVKTGDLAFVLLFSVGTTLFSAALPAEETTIRNASAPSCTV